MNNLILRAAEDLTFTSLPMWALAIIGVGGVCLVTLISCLVYVFQRRKKKTKKLEVAIDGNQEVKKEKLYLGFFRGFGHKTAIAYFPLYYVKASSACCSLCAPWDGKVLSYKTDSTKFTKMSDAISVGYHHIGCKCEDLPYILLETKIPKNNMTADEKKQQYEDKLMQFKFEERIRKASAAIFYADHKDEKNNLLKKRARLYDEYETFMKNKFYLTRQEKYEDPFVPITEAFH